MNLPTEKLQLLNTNPVLLSQEMAAVDKHAIEKIGIPGAVLMEQAGKAVAEVCLRILAGRHNAKVLVVCGAGNNGGDGFVVGRRLLPFVSDVQVILIGQVEKLRGDAELNAKIWKNLGKPILEAKTADETEFFTADLIVDAMLGTGAIGGLRPPFSRVTKLINKSAARVVAVDVPTGIDANTGSADPDAIIASATVTFGAAKPGLLFSPGRDHAGELNVVDIGFPQPSFESVSPHIFALNKNTIHKLLPLRQSNTFKNRCGQILLFAGSPEMPGAAALASEATLRTGAGLVVLGTNSKTVANLPNQPAEVMLEPLVFDDSKPANSISPNLNNRMKWANVTAIGPGLGTSPSVKFHINKIITEFDKPLIIDADGLNVVSENVDILKKRAGETVLTPHLGEFCRLSGIDKNELHPAPLQEAAHFAKKFNVILLLKGAPSLVAFPDGTIYINSAGNPGMATGGMGDVLTGVIAGLAGQMPLAEAAVLGMFLHSHAADLAIEKIDHISLVASDVIAFLPQAFNSIRSMRV